jgi:hypothetical protein
MNKKIIRFARGAKCGNGTPPDCPAIARSAASANHASQPNPQAEVWRNARRLALFGSMRLFKILESPLDPNFPWIPSSAWDPAQVKLCFASLLA